MEWIYKPKTTKKVIINIPSNRKAFNYLVTHKRRRKRSKFKSTISYTSYDSPFLQ